MCDDDAAPVGELPDREEESTPVAPSAIPSVEGDEGAEPAEAPSGGAGGGVATAGSDSGVEVAHGEYASSGAPEALSCASSLVSCGSGCDDSLDALSCRNGDRLEDFKSAVAGDGTSEGGSESSSVTGSGSTRGGPRRLSAGKKRVAVAAAEPGPRPKPSPGPRPAPTRPRAPALATRERARSREKSVPGDRPPPPTGPKPAVPPRSRPRAAPDSLALVCRESPSPKVKATKTSSARCRTPGGPPSPGLSSAPVVRVVLDSSVPKSRVVDDSKSALDKYATLPRRKRGSSPDLSAFGRDRASGGDSLRNSSTLRRSVARDGESPPLRAFPPYPKSRPTKIRIYHETGAQTALCGSDVESALAGVGIEEIRTDLVPVRKVSKGVQADCRNREIERLEAKVKSLTEANSKLQSHCDEQAGKLAAVEKGLEEERADKIAAQEELQRNTRRVLSMLGGESGGCGDSLVLLESQLRTSASVVVKQREEIDKLHGACRDLQRELNGSIKAYRSLEDHLEEAEMESSELQEFLQAEKATLQEALRESEEVVNRLQREIARSRRECRLLVRISEQRRHEMLAARARLAATRPSQVAPAALPALAQRLQTLLRALVVSYSISPDDLEDVIFHNEAYSRSASSEACSPGSPLPRAPPSASLPGPPPPFHSSRFSDDENSADLLDSETEPCLMMENVLEDVPVPDAHSHNLVSGGAPQGAHDEVPPMLSASQPNDSRLLRNDNRDDSFNSLHNITTFSGDELSPAVPDEKPASESSYCPDMDTFDLLNMGYSEHDSLQNLSQAILQRQQSEAECSMSEDMLNQRDLDAYANMSNSVIDQVIMVDNLVAKLLKTLKIIQSSNDVCGSVPKPNKEKLINISEENVGDVGEKMIIHSITQLAQNLNETLKDEEDNGPVSRIDSHVEKEWCNSDCKDPEKWCPKNCPTNSQMCSVEEQTSPRHSLPSLSECNVNSPQPIDSAA